MLRPSAARPNKLSCRIGDVTSAGWRASAMNVIAADRVEGQREGETETDIEAEIRG
jgi:hypothetical protein